MAAYNVEIWSAHTLTASNGREYYIAAGTTADDIGSPFMVAGSKYYIYWDEAIPNKYSTILASTWNAQVPTGKHVIASVTGQASTATTPVTSLEHDPSVVPGAQAINISNVTNQDSVTAAEISSIGTSVTTGGGSHPRLKFYTGGADAANGAHWLRGFTSNSTSDTTGIWYELANSSQAVNYYNGAATSLLLSAQTATGLRFYDGTAGAASDATTIAAYSGTGIKFYNDSGLGDANLLMNIMHGGGIRFYDGDGGNITLRIGQTAAHAITFYDGTTTDLGGANTVAIYGTTIGGTGATTSGTSLRFYNASGQGGADANKTVEFVGNGDGNENGMYVMGSTASDADLSTIGTKGDSLIKFEKGTSYIGNAQAGSYDLNKYGYLGVYSYSSDNYLALAAQTGTDLYLKTPEDLWLEADQIVSVGDGSNTAPAYSFATNKGTGLYYYASGANSFVTITADGDPSAYFGEGGAGIFFYETLWGEYLVARTNNTCDLGAASYKWRDAYVQCSTTTAGTDLVVTAGGLIARKSSSIQYKDNVKTLEFDSSKLNDLRPVSYNYKFENAPDIGLVAEEVHEILPELINYNEEGAPESVKYHSLTVMLLDEVRKLKSELKVLKEKD